MDPLRVSNPLLEEPYQASGPVNPLLDDEAAATPAQANPLLEEPEPSPVVEQPPAAGEPSIAQLQGEGSFPIARGQVPQLEQMLAPQEPTQDTIGKALQSLNEWRRQRTATIEQGETSMERLGITGAAEIAGGALTGMGEWIANFALSLGSAAAAKLHTDMSSLEALKFGGEFAERFIKDLKDLAPESLHRFMGEPNSPQAREALQSMGAVIEATVGKMGELGGEFVGGYVKGIANHIPEGQTKQFMLEAVPWAEQIGRFSTELYAFKAAGKVGEYVAEKVKRGERPLTPVEVAPGDRVIIDVLQEDFQPAEAAKRVAKDIDATLSKEQKVELRMTAKETVQRTLREHDLASIEADLGAGRIGPDVAKTLRENVELQDKQFAQRAEVERASNEYTQAIDRGDIPYDTVPAEIDPTTNKPIPFGNRAAAKVRSTSLAKEGIIAEPIKIPGTKFHALRLLEEDRVILSSKGKPFTLKGAEAKINLLKKEGVSAELRSVEQGYELVVTGYTKEAAAKRAAELREGPIREMHSGIPPDETIKRLLKKVGGRYDIDRLSKERAEWLRNVEEGKQVTTAQAVRDEAKTYIYIHSGIPIPPDLAGKIRRYAREHGMSVINTLRNKGYTDEAAGKMTAHIEKMGEIYENNLASGVKTKDSVRNRAALRKRALMLAEAHGMLTTKPIKKGKPIGQFSVEEVQTFLAAHDMPLSTPLKDATKRMKQAGLARQTMREYKDRGFSSFVETTMGKKWSRDLTVNELTALSNAMTRMHKVEGRFILKQEGGQPPITEAHLDMLGKISHLKPQGLTEGTTWFANRLDQAAPGFARTYINPILASENATVLEVMEHRHRFQQFLKDNKLTKADREAIGVWAVSRQEGGAIILESMGKQAKPLTRKQAEFYEYMRKEIFEPYFQRINEARALQNKDPMSYTENYFTFFRDLTALAEDGIHVLGSSSAALKQRITKARQLSFKHLKARKGSKLPVELDAAKVVEKYMLAAAHYVNTSPHLNKLRNLIETGFSRDNIVNKHGEAAWPESVQHLKAFKLGGINAPLYDSLNSWINYVAGVPIKDVGWEKLNKMATVMNGNLAYSVLSYNLGSTARQFGAWRNTWHATSTRDMIGGIYDAAADFISAEKGTRFGEKSKLRGAFAESDRLASRVFDAIVRHTLDVLEGKRETGGLLSYLYHKVGQAGLKPLAATDAMAARVAYYAIKRKGKRQGLKGRELQEYTDRGIIETQGSGTKAEVPPVLRTPAGRTIALFQTYVLNDWNYLVRRVLGKGQKKPTYARVASVMYYMYVTTALSAMFESLGVRSPFPTPIDAFVEAREKGAATPEAFARAAFELVEPVPFIGGAIRFGTSVGGPALSTITDIATALHGDPFSKPLHISAAKLFGVPGTTAFYNAYRALAKDTDSNVRGRRRIARRAR